MKFIGLINNNIVANMSSKKKKKLITSWVSTKFKCMKSYTIWYYQKRKGYCIYINMSEINTSHIRMAAVESNICDYRYRPVGMSIQKVIQLWIRKGIQTVLLHLLKIDGTTASILCKIPCNLTIARVCIYVSVLILLLLN